MSFFLEWVCLPEQLANWIHLSSGGLNAKHREVLELQAKAQARLARTRARFAQGLEDAQAVRKDLEWTQKKVT